MELNMTMLVQMVNFLFAYIIFDRIFLRVAVAHIRAEERKVVLLERQTKEQQARVTERTNQNEQNWFILQKRLQAECPEQHVGVTFQCANTHRSIDVSSSSNEVEEAVDDLKEMIVKVVLHDKAH